MASALENYVNNVRTLSTPENYRELAENISETVELLTKNYNMLDNVLETLDKHQHSLGVMYVLMAKFNSAQLANPDPVYLFKAFKDFIAQFDANQIRYATHAYYELCHSFTSFFVDKPQCMCGIKPIAQAIEKIQQCDSQLTPIHADLCQLCLKAKNFTLSFKFMDVDITTISTASDTRPQNLTTLNNDVNNDAKYFLLYYYYGGMIYTAVKNYERALYFYEVCISTPAMTMSHIMLEAYKKFTLVSLILHGKMMDVHKFSSQVLTRFMKPLAQTYNDLVTAYATLSPDELEVVINKNREVYIRDNNMGLVKLVVKSLYKKNIKRLTKTFLTLSLADVGARAHLSNPNDAEKLIFQMIISGEIFAKVSQKDGMVVFKENPEGYDTPEMFLKIQEQLAKVVDLNKHINNMEEGILLNPVYIKKLLGNQDEDLASQHGKPFVGDPTD